MLTETGLEVSNGLLLLLRSSRMFFSFEGSAVSVIGLRVGVSRGRVVSSDCRPAGVVSFNIDLFAFILFDE